MGPGSGKLVESRGSFPSGESGTLAPCLGAKTERIPCQCHHPAHVHPRKQSHYDKILCLVRGSCRHQTVSHRLKQRKLIEWGLTSMGLLLIDPQGNQFVPWPLVRMSHSSKEVKFPLTKKR